MPISTDDIRASAPILTYPEVAVLAHMPEGTLRTWARGRGNRTAIVHTHKPFKRGFPSIPLVGLAEASSLRALRKGGMKMTEIARAADFIRRESGDNFALTNPRLVTDGATAFVQYDHGLRRIRDGQEAFVDILRHHLEPLHLGPDGYVDQFIVDQDTGITIDPRFNSGRPAFARSRIPVFAVLGSLAGGDSPDEVADDYGITIEEVRSVESRKDYFSLIA